MQQPKENKKIKKSTLAAVVVLAALAVVVVVFALLNRAGVAEKRRYQDEAEFLITLGDTQVVVTMDDILSLDLEEVETIYKKSGKESEIRYYNGVPFADILALKGIDASGYDSVVFTAADGYASALPIADALDPERCYIMIGENGEPLGRREDGGSGPYRMILPKDEFSLRWCRYLMEVTFQ